MSETKAGYTDSPRVVATADATPLWRRFKLESLPIIVVFFVLIGVYITFAPSVFLRWPIYNSFLITIPPLMVLSLGLTLVIAAGEMDLSFPAVITLSGFLFAYCTLAGAAGGHCRRRAGRSDQRLPGGGHRHSLDHHHHRHVVFLDGGGDRAVGRHVLRPAESGR